LIAIKVEPECRSVTRSLSGRGPKGESDASIATESEITDLLRMLKLIQRSDSSMIAIRIEPDYKSVTSSLSRWGPKGELNITIVAESEVANFLRQRRSCSCYSDLL
jgi:hypothetical protein